ncbi:carboxymuconolactone decarboxylase family protein [archaeon]|nr:carboxymuconolactone decarboxylase family protein [archaeon]NCP79285.1 carboxymuconolactone decarboxylase family protein [archaeon]NCP98256.1 carboxymuconolactone decarboxylase family protein [archaeon]NCQ07052.1 carboxymuconolactone decarboxylase family protein [archaeon]NCQ50848.1 carboxymuconolactone decarboxylase family protein [archaeon]
MKNEEQKFNDLFIYLKKNNLEHINAFQNFMQIVENDGKVSSKVKEAVALGIAIKSQCKGCIFIHTKNALNKGYTKEEILEIAWVAVLMGGGPSFVYLSYVKEALEEYK